MKKKDVSDLHKSAGGAGTLSKIQAATKTVVAPKPSILDDLRAGLVTSEQLQSIELPKHPLLLDEWFADSDLGFVFASRGVGKTWFAMGLARALAEGGGFGPWKADGRVPVLYVDGEMNAEQIKARDAGLKRAGGDLLYLNHELLFHRAERVINLCNPDWQKAITDLCLETGRKVLILDNLSCLFSGMAENKNDEWEQVLPWLLHLRRRGIAVIIIHHAGRDSKVMRGASRREDSAAWVIRLDDALDGVEVKNGARFVSLFTKPSRHVPAEIAPLKWEIRTDEATGVSKVTFMLATGLEVFRQWIRDGVTKCSEIAEEMGISKGQVSKLAKKGEAAGWLTISGREYALTEEQE